MTETGRWLFPFVRRAAAAAVVACASPAFAAGKSSPDFDREIRPILVAKCFACHGPDAEGRKAGLRLDTFEGATAALDEGARAIAPGDPDASLLLARVAHADPEERMPPHGEPLTAAEIDAVRRWIAAGAAYADPWAFRPIRQTPPPAVRDADWCRNDLDRFVLATRESAGLVAPRADVEPAALLRRLSFDLRGLPPSESDVRAFVADPSDARYAEFVERYLADPAFGERWGRHWLDLARYAETLAHEFDYEIPHAWRYRDYVIEAFNADLPPARFVAEQIAGDLLPPRPGLGMPNVAPVATAWWFLGPATHAPVNVRQDEADRIAGAVDVAGRSLFGLSIACARCHDHKFDPIPARDFFALAGVARNTRRIEGHLDASPDTARLASEAGSLLADAARAASAQPSLLADTRAADAASFRDDLTDGGASWRRSGHAFAPTMPLAAFDADGTLRARESGTIDSGRVDSALVGSARSAPFAIDRPFLHVRVRGTGSGLRVAIDNYWLDDRNALLFEGMRRGVESADPAKDSRGEIWRTETFDLTRFVGERAYVELVDHGGGAIEVDWIALTADRAAPDAGTWDIDGPAVLGAPDAPGVAEARASFATVAERLRREPAPVRAIVAEDGGSLDEPIHVRGVSRNYGDPAPRARLSILGARSDAPVEGSGRLALVESLTDPSQPFLWRTTANRIWLKLLGRGVVETPDDFGQLGSAPWSTELLDHLAARLASGATFKELIRDIVGSRAYRAAPDAGDAAAPATAWRPEPIRRLDAESIRDAMLAASGTLRDARGGPGVAARLTEHMQGRGRPGRSGPVDGEGRRSVYLEVRRNFLDPFLQAFDQPAPATTCGRRHASNVPAQALALMNSELTHLLSDRWAERMLASDGSDDAARIEAMWYAAFARAPRPDERDAALGFLAEERGHHDPADPAARERAAYAALAHALFSAKEFVFLR